VFLAARGRRLAAFVAAAALLAVPVAVPGGAGAVEPRLAAGASGVGDPYFANAGNDGHDAQHYDIGVRYALASGRLDGTTTVTSRAKQDLSRFNLDLVLQVSAVTVDGRPARFSQTRRELTVVPESPIARGATFRTTVTYAGKPDDVFRGGTNPWISTDTEVMATNEPHIAAWWFPSNDHPSDKATFDIAVTVPTGQQAISNGDYAGTTSAAGWDTWRWHMPDPMATYLAFFAAGRFQTESGVSRGLPFFNAVSMGLTPGNRADAMRLMRRSPAIVRWLETQLGPYPFGSTGGVTTSLFAGFALENQTRPTYPFLGNGGYGRTTVVHELAHQWFGDHVSVDRWRDIWLNEGFATWFEWRYAETHGGRSAQHKLLARYHGYDADDPLWRANLADPGRHHLFSFPVYERGAMAVQALRTRIGDKAFDRLLRTWVERRGDGTGRVGQLERLAEEVSGMQLDRFFDTWLRSGRKPARTAANGLR
jgi:aminopeptidase N